MRPGRARPLATGLATMVAVAVAALWLVSFRREVWVVVPLAAAAYVAGPLWTPARYRLDAEGVERSTPFGTARWAWSDLASYEGSLSQRVIRILRRGRGVARVLPPVLLLWEPGPGVQGFAEALTSRLAERLPGRIH